MSRMLRVRYVEGSLKCGRDLRERSGGAQGSMGRCSVTPLPDVPRHTSRSPGLGVLCGGVLCGGVPELGVEVVDFHWEDLHEVVVNLGWL